MLHDSRNFKTVSAAGEIFRHDNRLSIFNTSSFFICSKSLQGEQECIGKFIYMETLGIDFIISSYTSFRIWLLRDLGVLELLKLKKCIEQILASRRLIWNS